MYYVADANRLLAEGVLTQAQVAIMRVQAREVMMRAGVNTLLVGGIIAATLGLIAFLASPLPVAVTGGFMLFGGLMALSRDNEMLGFFGNAAALIGAGLLIGGAGAELMSRYGDIAGPVMLGLGALVALVFGLAYRRPRFTSQFACGSIFAMGVALHLTGLGWTIEYHTSADWVPSLGSLYAAAVLVASGVWLNVRLVTALALVPFAQALSTSTEYWHAAYVFYSPESTLSILQMGALIGACLWAAPRLPEAMRGHASILATMAAIVANLCALVGSLWGDEVGKTIWGPKYWDYVPTTTSSQDPAYLAGREALATAREAYEASAIVISADVYSILWALALAAAVLWSAHTARRGLFNTAMTFAGIHAYTQLFESFGDEPLAYVVGGLAAIPAAYGLWRMDRWIVARGV